MLSVFDDIEIKLDEWGKKEKKKEDIEDSNAIPPRKESIADKIDKLGKKSSNSSDVDDNKKQQKRDSSSKKLQFEVPWKHSKKTIKDFRKLIGI